MTRCSTGFHTRTYRTLIVGATGGCLLAGFFVTAGCTQQQQQAAAGLLGMQAPQVATTAVTSTVAGQNPKPKTIPSGVKFDGKGGYDASQAQQNALARAHWYRDHHNEVYRPSWPKPVTGTTQPATSQPVAASAKTLGRAPGAGGVTPYGRLTP